MPTRVRVQISLFLIVAALTLLPQVSAGAALCAGILYSLIFGNPILAQTRKWTPKLLQLSVIGLGAGMNLVTVASVGSHGILYTAVGIAFTFSVGLALQIILKTERTVSILLASGTAICGGSAIAAVSPVVHAQDHEMSVSLATVFVLNAAALFLFPWIGFHVGFTQTQFGLWSALAIHDTSSVVGASMQYGKEALAIATTVKLARALWIVPLTFVIGLLWNRGQKNQTRPPGKKPWFILGFVIMAAIVTWIPQLQGAGEVVAEIARRSLVLTLFLIGSGLTRETLRKVGMRPLIHGLVLWIIVGSITFLAIQHQLIH